MQAYILIKCTPGSENKFYGTENFNVVNFGITASIEIKISEHFSLPIFGTYILNPNQDQGHFVFGISI